MSVTHRFASLKGASRKWLSQAGYDLEDDADWALEEADAADLGGRDHDGWAPVMPRNQPLVRLEELLSR